MFKRIFFLIPALCFFANLHPAQIAPLKLVKEKYSFPRDEIYIETDEGAVKVWDDTKKIDYFLVDGRHQYCNVMGPVGSLAVTKATSSGPILWNLSGDTPKRIKQFPEFRNLVTSLQNVGGDSYAVYRTMPENVGYANKLGVIALSGESSECVLTTPKETCLLYSQGHGTQTWYETEEKWHQVQECSLDNGSLPAFIDHKDPSKVLFARPYALSRVDRFTGKEEPIITTDQMKRVLPSALIASVAKLAPNTKQEAIWAFKRDTETVMKTLAGDPKNNPETFQLVQETRFIIRDQKPIKQGMLVHLLPEFVFVSPDADNKKVLVTKPAQANVVVFVDDTGNPHFVESTEEQVQYFYPGWSKTDRDGTVVFQGVLEADMNGESSTLNNVHNLFAYTVE